MRCWALAGARIPGGCDSCEAYQQISDGGIVSPGVHMIQIRHDDNCPVLARMSAR